MWPRGQVCGLCSCPHTEQHPPASQPSQTLGMRQTSCPAPPGLKDHTGQPKIGSRGSTASFFLFLLPGQGTVVAAVLQRAAKLRHDRAGGGRMQCPDSQKQLVPATAPRGQVVPGCPTWSRECGDRRCKSAFVLPECRQPRSIAVPVGAPPSLGPHFPARSPVGRCHLPVCPTLEGGTGPLPALFSRGCSHRAMSAQPRVCHRIAARHCPWSLLSQKGPSRLLKFPSRRWERWKYFE